MSITKKDFNKDLWPYYSIGKMLAGLLSKIWGIKLFRLFDKISSGKSIKGLRCEERYIQGKEDKHEIRIRIFSPLNVDKTLPAMLFLHGGGYFVGTPEQSLKTIKQFIDKRPTVVIAPDYRKSVKDPFPAGFNDCYDTLLWMKNNISALNISDEFIVAGQSAGGGLTAALSLKARDSKEVKIKFQLPIYPMLDDRQQTDSAKSMINVPVWNASTNKFAWQFYLQGLVEQGLEIPAYASPARSDNYSGLPPTITFVGEMEPFKDETITYVENLKAAEIPVMFKIFNKAFHGFDVLAPKSQIAIEANEFLMNAFAKYHDIYFGEKSDHEE